MRSLIAFYKREFKLLWENPREYLYSFTYSATKTVHIGSYDPEVTKLGERLVAQIKQNHPELDVRFLGSAALKIAGQRDIDILVGCNPDYFPRYEPALVTLFGPAQKKRKQFMEWHLEIDQCDVEILMVNPNSPMFKDPIKTCATLQQNPLLRAQYELLKRNSNGISVREYKKRRLVFFHQIS